MISEKRRIKIYKGIRRRYRHANYKSLLEKYFELCMADRALEQEVEIMMRIRDRRARVEKILEYFQAHNIEV